MGLFDSFSALAKMREIQEKISKLDAELLKMTSEGVTGGGLVRAVVNGKRELIKITIANDAAVRSDLEMLEDLIVAAVNQAIGKTQERIKEHLDRVTGGLPIPGLDKLIG